VRGRHNFFFELRKNSTETIPELSPLSKRQRQNKNKEVIMTAVAFVRNSEFEATCAKCGKALTAPKWSEYVSDGLVLKFWHCLKCGYQFETEAYVSADAAA
jgi:ribosomal protein L37AE/L43A